MRIGCLQFASHSAEVDRNLARADEILKEASGVGDLDILVFPELTFSGSGTEILAQASTTFGENAKGVTAKWAEVVAKTYECAVVVGYPEKIDPSRNWPTDPKYFNSASIFGPDGKEMGHYQEFNLHTVPGQRAEERWALRGRKGFFQGELPGLGIVALGMGADLEFQGHADKFEFASHIVQTSADLVVVCMASRTQHIDDAFGNESREPDVEALTKWVRRLTPLILSESGKEIVVIFANRCGNDGTSHFSGTSAVVGIRDGAVTVYGVLGRCDEKLMAVDTAKPGRYYLEEVWVTRDEDSSPKRSQNSSFVSQELRLPGWLESEIEKKSAQSCNASKGDTLINRRERRDCYETPNRVGARDHALMLSRMDTKLAQVWREPPKTPGLFTDSPVDANPSEAQVAALRSKVNDWCASLPATARKPRLSLEDPRTQSRETVDSRAVTPFTDLTPIVLDTMQSLGDSILRPPSTKSRSSGQVSRRSTSRLRSSSTSRSRHQTAPRFRPRVADNNIRSRSVSRGRSLDTGAQTLLGKAPGSTSKGLDDYTVIEDCASSMCGMRGLAFHADGDAGTIPISRDNGVGMRREIGQYILPPSANTPVGPRLDILKAKRESGDVAQMAGIEQVSPQSTRQRLNLPKTFRREGRGGPQHTGPDRGLSLNTKLQRQGSGGAVVTCDMSPIDRDMRRRLPRNLVEQAALFRSRSDLSARNSGPRATSRAASRHGLVEGRQDEESAHGP